MGPASSGEDEQDRDRSRSGRWMMAGSRKLQLSPLTFFTMYYSLLRNRGTSSWIPLIYPPSRPPVVADTVFYLLLHCSSESKERPTMANVYGLLLSAWLLLLLLIGVCRGSTIGVCYGRNADNLPTPDKVAQLVLLHNIKYVRIYDSNIQVLKAFANTGVELVIGIPNSDLLPFSQFQTNADTWLQNNILPYYPATKITHITVGSETTETPSDFSAMVVPAMRNVHTALRKAGLQRKMKVSTIHSLGVLSNSYPPSAATFDSKFFFFLKPLLGFLAENHSPFMVDVYPYYAYMNSLSNVSLEYALFQSSSQVIDQNTGLLYTNMFDAQIDALYYALAALNFSTIRIMVTETGWPSKGSVKETAATPDNSLTYNANLIRHVINDTGTPARPGEELDVYIFSLFNENRKPGMESERNWGLFNPDETSIYDLDLTGAGESPVTNSSTNNNDTSITAGPGPANITGLNGTWCIASSSVNESALQIALDWACGQGNVDCSGIQAGQPCFEPDTLIAHASYAFNSYYHQNGGTEMACSFGGAGMPTTVNPSHDRCFYLTTLQASRNGSLYNSTVSPLIANPSSSGRGGRVWSIGMVASCIFFVLFSFL